MLDQVLSAVIDALLAIPPVRFVMGLVESRWRPLWAALWIAVIVYLISRTMSQLALRRARLRILSEAPDGRSLTNAPSGGGLDPAPADASVAPVGAGATSGPTSGPRAAGDPTSVPMGTRRPTIPLPVVGAAVIVGALAVVGVAVATRSAPNDSTAAVRAPVADSAAAGPDTPIDIRYRSGRMDDDHCIGTFEVTRGRGSRARFVAFVMDTSGAIIGRDSAQVASAVAGLFVEFRFRYVDCEEIDDWQIQATTTTPRQ